MSTISIIAIIAIVAFAAVMLFIAHISTAKRQTNSTYHVANRNVPGIIGALSVASTWVWAPALFVSATQGFNNGWVGAAWFIIPNAAALLLMLPFAFFIRRRYPTGFTLAALMRKTYGKNTQWLYTFTQGGLATLSVSVNLLAGGTVISMLTGIPFFYTVTGMLILVFAYTYRHGVKASLITNAIQMILIIGVLATLVPAMLNITGFDILQAGINGINDIQNFFSVGGLEVAVTFGIISAIGLMAGPLGDQAFWQRAFAMRKGQLVQAFGGGALLFIIVPLLMAVMGFMAAGLEFQPEQTGYVNLELVTHLFPAWVSIPFMLIVVSALFSIVNSHLLAQASLISDYSGKLDTQKVVMLGLGVVALLVALIPGNSVATMFLIYSTLRSATFLITVTTLSGAVWNRRGVELGITVGLVVGFPMAVYGNAISGAWEVRLIAILITTLVPIIFAVIASTIHKGSIADEGYIAEAEKYEAVQ